MFTQGCDKDSSSKVLNEATNHVGDEWMLDLGSTYHMYPNKSRFKGFKEMEEFVLLGDMKFCQILDLGNLILEMTDDNKMDLHEVIYVPEVRKNLISLSALDANGCSILIDKGSIKVNT